MMVVVVGVVSFLFPGGKLLVLNNCLYVPNVRRNLISISCLLCNRYSAIFNKNMVSIKCNADDICNGMLVENLYILEPISHDKLTQLNLTIREKNHPQLTKPSFGTLD